MADQSILLLYEDGSQGATITGGSFEGSLPSSNLLDDNLKKPARTTDVTLASTQFKISFDATYYARAIVVGPANLTPIFQYRASRYTDNTFTISDLDTGWIQPAASQGDPGSFHWGEDDFWLRNDHLGGYIIHPFTELTPGQYWKIEIDDQANPDGYLDLGRLFMPLGLQPSYNYDYGSTFGMKNNSLVLNTLSGGKKIRRRANPRTLRVNFPVLPEDEGYGQVYRFLQKVGFDAPIFVIPDPDEASTINSRSFFGTLTESESLTQVKGDFISAGFQIEEII